VLKRAALLAFLPTALLLAASPAAHASGGASVTARNTTATVIWPTTAQVCVAASDTGGQGWANVQLSDGTTRTQVVSATAGSCSPWVFVSANGAAITQLQACDQYAIPHIKIVTTCSRWVTVRP
jgi:hypothetical protein